MTVSISSLRRLVAMVFALGVCLAFPVGNDIGAPIHATRIDTTLMAIGFFILFWMPLAAAIEFNAFRRPRLARTRRDFPTARVVR